MSGKAPERNGEGAPRRVRARRVAVAASVLALAAAGGVWLSRVPIATGVIDRELARRGVPARYRIADLGFGRQRLTNVVIGDPADPDLVADWIETDTDVGFSGPRLLRLRAGRVRVRGRMVGTRVSFGAVDRLLPASTGAPFALPALDVALGDGRLRLDTPYGVAGIAVSGQGRLDRGFHGHYALAAHRLGAPTCTATGLDVVGRIRSLGANRLALDGPARVATIACTGAQAERLAATMQATLVLGVDRGSTLSAKLATGRAAYRGAQADAVRGTVALVQRAPDLVTATTRLVALRPRTRDLSAGTAAIDGDARFAAGVPSFDGRVAVADADVRALLPRFAGAGAGTPVAPLVTHAARALDAAARRVSGTAQVALRRQGDVLALGIAAASARSASGAAASLGGRGATWRSDRGLLLDATFALDGGGLPRVTAALRRASPAAPLTGTATVAPYAAGGAALALTPIGIRAAGGVTRITTQATLSGPLADGRVDRLTLPLDVRLAPDRVALNPACTPLAVERVAVAGLRLDPARLTLCPTGAALVTIANGRADGGARIAAPRLTGALGATPLRLAAASAEFRLGTMGLTLAGLATRLGDARRETRLDIARLTGSVTPRGIAGDFAGAGGQIANVPLLLSDAAGRWTLVGGRLALAGALKVRDAAADARFQPMEAQRVTLALAGGRIAAAGTLVEPTRGVKVAEVAIAHLLGPGTGRATIDVPGITFDDAFQPDLLTRLTFGVIADVKGTVKGAGTIDWGGPQVASTGTFSTADTNLAAAFGPVEGITGTIRFTDLLALESAPAQVATVKSINPGVPVTDGRITYRTLPGSRVDVASGVWPFAGGTLTLEPTLLDFSSPSARRMTFRVDAMDAGKFLQQFEFQNLNATGVFDGVLPMVFDEAGGRIEGGRLVARPGGGALAYVGELSRKQLGFWGDFAFQALKSLTYRDLHLTMNGPLAGEMLTEVRFAGIRQGAGAKSNFLLRRLTRLPIVFNIRIRAPFRGLIDSAASFYDPTRLVARNLQQLLEEQNRRTAPGAGAPAAPPPASVQPPASGIVPPPKQD